ncbi:hypothetical protein BJ742DRAFT_56769 [Cladochytrium replicatum]|nr:hypothetical protein BJ742DRAFT_56769 [Cladochytrium replicatum]
MDSTAYILMKEAHCHPHHSLEHKRSSGSSGIVSAGAVQTQYGKVDVTRLDSSEILWYAVEGMLSAKSTLSDSPLAATALLRGVVAGESWLVRRLVEGGGARVGLWSCDETAWTRGLPRPMRVVLGNAMYTLWDVTRTHAPAKGQRMIGFVHGMLSASFAAAKRREAVWTPENECENRDGLALIPKPLLLSVSRLVRWSLMLPERGYAQPISVPVSTAYNHAHIYPASNNPSRHGHPRAQDVRALFRDCGDLSLDNEGLDKAFVASVLLRCAASGNVDGVERMLQWVGRSVIEDVRVDVGDASAEDVVWFLRRMVGVRRVVERERDVVPDLVRYLLSKKGSYSDGAAETEELKVQRVVCGELLFDAAIRGDTRMVRAFVDGLDTASASYDNRVPVVDRIAFLREQGAGGKLQRHLKAALNRKHFATAMVLVQHGFSLRGVGADTLRLLFDAAELAADSGNVLEQLVVSVRVTAACRALEEMVMWEDDDADGSRTIGAADEYSDARILPRLEAPESMWETLTSVYDHATDERVRESYRRSANHAPIASSSCARQLLLYSLESNMDDWESGLKPILVRSISKGYPAGMIRLVVETAMDRWRSKVPHELEDTLSSASDIFVMDGHSEDTIAELDMVDATGAEILSMPKVVDNDGNGAHVGAGGTPGWAVVVSDLCTMIGNLCSSSTGSSHETSVLRALVEPLAVCASEGDEDACQAVEGAVGWGWIKKCYGESVERANEPALQVLLRARAGSAHVQIRELAQTIARGFKVCKRGDPGAFGTNEMGFDGSFAWNLCRWATSLKVDSDMGMSEGELNSVAVSGLDDSALSPLSGPSTLVEMPAIFSEEVVFFSPTVGWDVIGVLRNGYEHLVEQRTVE